MIDFPPLPSWDGLHPLIIHFPIALLLVAPLFVALGVLFAKKHGRGLLLAAFVLMILGTASTFVAVSTGEAAGKLAERTPAINAVLEHHEALAERTRLVFSILTVVFAALLVAPRFTRRPLEGRAAVAAYGVFLLFYLTGAVLLANTAHNGGRLVHEFGVQSLMASEPLPATTADADD